ncbi:dual specificity protein phosphatase 18 [Colossoma macropomum]|uniref:dual specificity protein phosphatase 18 n=1 Tax=Colossoma macropomum TaxID=42526 RepID=UPI00186510B3|nr:dual specificity protein phosphatase 18 [Colossoma macropomum]XP_036454935.1 dual specificity protein phosphatase 18 [Colossoma macropomum]
MSVPGSRLSGLGQITDYLYIGNAKAAKDSSVITRLNINCIINATLDDSKPCLPSVDYVWVPVADSPETQLEEHFDTVADKIDKVRMQHGRVVVHCCAGVSRSATLCLAFLMKHCSMSLVEAHGLVKSRRPIIRPNAGFWKQLIEYEVKLRGTRSVMMVSSPVGLIPDLYEKETRGLIPF